MANSMFAIPGFILAGFLMATDEIIKKGFEILGIPYPFLIITAFLVCVYFIFIIKLKHHLYTRAQTKSRGNPG